MTENHSKYRAERMPETDGNRDVKLIDGEPGEIRSRANDIEDLAERMSRAAATLQLFADGTIGKGDSFEAIREQAKEVHSDLSVAADRYRPSGVALRIYANALERVQTATDWRVRGAEDEWPEVQAASLALLEAEQDLRAFDRAAERAAEDEDPGPRPTTGTEQQRFDTAVAAWEAYWGGYDAPVERFEGTYDNTVGSLEDSNENGVKDGFWDNAMPFVEGMLKVLTFVAIAALLVAFIATGPLALLAGALAAVAGVLSLAGELAKMAAGRGDWTSLALAAISIVPFGKFAKLAEFAPAAARFPRLAGVFRAGGDDVLSFTRGLDGFLDAKMPTLFKGAHGLNSINLMRMLRTPEFALTGNKFVGTWRGGWMALAGNPATPGQAIAGAADVYFDAMTILNSLKPTR